MPGWDGNGNFTRVHNWQADDASDIGIVSDRHDAEDDNFAQGLNNTFCRDGQSPATGEWNLDNHQLNNVGAGTEDGDAINLGQLTGSGPTGTPDFKKSINLVGSDLNGRVNFRSATGVQGIGWTGADMSWLARLKDSATTPKFRDRLVANNKFDGTGTDVAILDDAGNLGVTSLTYNLSLDPAGNWRTISPGWGALLEWQADGKLAYRQNKTVTATDPYVAAPLDNRVTMEGKDGNIILTLNMDETGDKYARLLSTKGGEKRWEMNFGNGVAESGTWVGSNWSLWAYNNDGAGGYQVLYAIRETGRIGIPFGIDGTLTVHGGTVYTNVVNSIGANGLILGGNIIYLRPNGYASGVGQVSVDTVGNCRLGVGITERSGTGATSSYGSQIYNSLYGSNGSDLRWYVGDSIVGYYTPACDHRIKREIRALPSAWEAVKKLRPVIFKEAAFGDGPDSPFRDREDDRVGFIAHELQDALGAHAATGVKDWMEDVVEEAEDGSTKVVGQRPAIQGPDVMAVVAALTSALQEAQLRIEALEARLAA